jgi:hypothetical protein
LHVSRGDQYVYVYRIISSCRIITRLRKPDSL